MAVQMQADGGRRGNPLRKAVWGTAGLLLLLPLVAMQFTREVDWNLADFIIIGAMLLAACAAYELAVWLSGNPFYRAGFGAAIVGAFLLVWVNLAVGAIGSEDDPANLMFAGVLAVGLVGALIARFRPRGMALTMLAVAAAQVLVALIAGIAGWGLPESRPVQLVGITLFFLGPWLVSAWLFGMAARRPAIVPGAR